MPTFFKPPFWKSLQIVSCLLFKLLKPHGNSLCIRCIVVVISLGILKIWAKNTIFDKANVLKVIILPYNKRFLRRHILKTFSIPVIVFLKFCSRSIFLLYEKKKKTSIFIAFLVKSIQQILQNATFSSHIPVNLTVELLVT